VTEGQLPANFAFVGVSCTHTGSGTSTTTNGQTANISLGLAGNVVCTYTNQLLAGAIRINKTSSKAAATPLSGAKFFLCTNNTNSTSDCVAAVDESGTTVTNPVVTDSNGTVCVGNLPFGSYFVFESAAPSGYAIDDSSTHPASVAKSGDCSSATSASVTLPFKDTPLTDLSVNVHSEATGGTQSSIDCVVSGTTNEINGSPQPPTGVTDPVNLTSNGLRPGTYTCTITIDP
jgi:uncharacterized surface anchored protein